MAGARSLAREPWMEHRGRGRMPHAGPVRSRAILAALAVVVAGWLLLGPLAVAAASPAATPEAAGGDTRTPGEGAGLVGNPILVALGVVALGVLVAGATTAYVRLTAGPPATGESLTPAGDRATAVPAGTGSAGPGSGRTPDRPAPEERGVAQHGSGAAPTDAV